MKTRPLGHHPFLSPTRALDHTPNPDDDDQAALRAFGRGLDAQMFEADVGGVLLLSSKKSMAWIVSFPRWAGLTNEGTGLRLRTTKTSTPEGREAAEATIGYVAGIRDLAFEIHGFFARFYNDINRRIEASGGSIDHKRLGTPGHMGPYSSVKAEEKKKQEAAIAYDPETCITAAELRALGVGIGAEIPDAAWVPYDCIRRTAEPQDPEMRIQIWQAFRWLETSAMDREEDPPFLEVRRPPPQPPEGENTDAPSQD